MPQDTTIYWDGYGSIPPPILELPDTMQVVVLEKILEKRKELEYFDPTWIYISAGIFILLFSAAAIFSNRKMKKKMSGENAGKKIIFKR